MKNAQSLGQLAIRSGLGLFSLLLSEVAGSQVLFSEEFDGTSLSSSWTVERGYASVSGGWAYLHGSTPGSRDADILTGVGSNWSDYELTTVFDSTNGPGSANNAIINFRVQHEEGWASGTFYSLYLFPSNSGINPPGPNTAQLYKYVNNYGYEMARFSFGSLMTAGANLVDLTVTGGQFDLSLNGQHAFTYTDTNPLLTGGIGLGSIWESQTQYDYVHVTGTTSATPEPSTLVSAVAGLGLFYRFRRRMART